MACWEIYFPVSAPLILFWVPLLTYQYDRSSRTLTLNLFFGGRALGSKLENFMAPFCLYMSYEAGCGKDWHSGFNKCVGGSMHTNQELSFWNFSLPIFDWFIISIFPLRDWRIFSSVPHMHNLIDKIRVANNVT